MNPQEIDAIINEASRMHGVPVDLIKTIIRKESSGNPNAIGPRTRSGENASGLMQLMPGTAREMGVNNILDPKENIFGGTKYLAQMLKRYNGDVKLAAAAYNAGPSNVDKYGGVPPFKETQNYTADLGNVEDPIAAAKAKYPDVRPNWTGNPQTMKAEDPYGGWKPGPIDPNSPLARQQRGGVGPDEIKYAAKDPETGEDIFIVAHKDDPEPSDEEVDAAIAEHRENNKPVDEFKEGALGVGQAGKFAQGLADDPLGTVGNLVKGVGEMAYSVSGFKPGRRFGGAYTDIIKPAYDEARDRVDSYAVRMHNAGDLPSKLGAAAQAVLASAPVIGEMVPFLESNLGNPEKMAGGIVSKGVDAALARFIPPAIGAVNRGAVKPLGRAMARSGAERLGRIETAPPTPVLSHVKRLLGRYTLPVALAQATGMQGVLAPIVAALEGGRAIKNSPRLARGQSRLGSILAQGTDLPPSRIKTAAELWDEELATKGFDEEFTPTRDGNYGALTPEQIEQQGGVIRPDAGLSVDELWEKKQLESERPSPIPEVELNRADDIGDLDFESLEEIVRQEELARNRVPTPEEQWEVSDIQDKPRGVQDLNEPVRQELPEIKGKEGKRLYGEDQNRVSKMAKKKKAAEELGVDESEITLEDEPDIVPDRGGKFKKVESAPKSVVKVDPNEPVLTFADFEAGDRVNTSNGKGATLVRVEGPSAVIKLDSGQTVKIARKSIKKVETSPKSDLDVDDIGESSRPKEGVVPKSEPTLNLSTKGKYVDIADVPEGQIRITEPNNRGYIEIVPDEANPNYLSVRDIWVDPAMRRQGIATSLYQQALDRAKAEGKEGIISYTSHRNAHSDKRWNRLLREGLAEKLDNKGTLILRRKTKNLSSKIETDLEKAVREASDSVDEVEDITDSTNNNASGESSASAEAMSRQKAMAAQKEKYVVYDRAGNKRPLIGPDAVDYVARNGETYGIEGPDGFRSLDNKGGKVPVGKVDDVTSGNVEPNTPKEIKVVEGPKAPTGECFRNANKWMTKNASSTDRLVHGKITNGEGKTFDHAWVESGDNVIDPTTDVTMPKDKWYGLVNAKPEARYTGTESVRNMIKNKHHGPWESVKESIDEPIGNVDPLGTEPVRKASGARVRVEKKFVETTNKLENSTPNREKRNSLTNDRMTGRSQRQLGLNDRSIQKSKAAWNLSDDTIYNEGNDGIIHAQANIDDILKLTKSKSSPEELKKAHKVLTGKGNKPTAMLRLEGNKLVLDGADRLAAAKSLGELGAPIRMTQEVVDKLKELKIPIRNLIKGLE